MPKYIFSLMLVSSVLLVGCSAQIVSEESSSTPQKTEEEQLSSKGPLTHDWGNINIMGGDVNKTFTLINSGQEPLLITGAVTSCMCTTATLKPENGEESGIFGMHGGPDWKYTLEPSESIEVSVIFDPLAHGPTATGPIQRTVNIITDPNPNTAGTVYTRIDVRGNVLSEADFNALSS